MTSSIKMFVLDEADEMLSRGFKEQIYEVFKRMPQDVQVIPLTCFREPALTPHVFTNLFACACTCFLQFMTYPEALVQTYF